MANRLPGAARAALFFACLVLLPSGAGADSHQGVVRQIRIDADSDAALCVALDAKHTCIFEWTQRDTLTNRAEIRAMTCSAT